MIAAGAGLHVLIGVAFQVSRPFPTLAFVVRKGNRQTVAPAFEIIVNEEPQSVAQHDGLKSRARVREFGIDGSLPGQPAVGRLADLHPVRWGAIVPHESDQGSIAPLDKARLHIAEAKKWPAGKPGFSPVVADSHQGKIKAIGVKRNDETSRLEHKWMNPSHPAQATGEFVGHSSALPLEP